MNASEAVVAGSPEFLGAVLAPLQGRLGGAPRVADSPHLAFALCQDSARLLVYEYRGQEWLPLSHDLRREAGPEISIVVALPPEHAAVAAELSSTASAVVAWSGDPRAVLEAVSRVVAPQAAPAAGRPAPVLAPTSGGAPLGTARPAVTPSFPIAPAAPAPRAPPSPAGASGGPRPAVTPAPRPAVTPVRAAPPVRPVAAVPRPVVTPVAPIVPPVLASPRPAVTPVGAGAPPVAPRAAAAAALAPERPPAAAAAPPPPVHLVPDEPDPFADLFSEPAGAAATEGEAVQAEEVAAPAAAPAPAPAPVEIPVVSSGTWPGTLLSASDAEGLLAGALVGLWPEEKLRPLTASVLAGLSGAEKAALQDQPLPFDAGPVKRAAGLRWQVAAALGSVPAEGTPVDEEAVKAILASIDGVLADLKALSDDATPEALRAIENVRHAVVKEAIDLTEAVQRVVPADVVAEITGSRPLRRGPATRMLYSTAGAGVGERPKPWGMIVLFLLTLAAAAGYHGYRYVNRPQPQPPAVTGAPSGSVGTISAQGKLVFAPAGKQLDPREVESFKNAEAAKGNEVREVLPGTFVVIPGSAKGTGSRPAEATGQEGKP